MAPRAIRDRLARAAASVFAADLAGQDDAQRWLAQVSAPELLRIDGWARGWRWEGPALGPSQAWTDELLSQGHPVAPFLASLHPDGHVRERAVAQLAASEGTLSDLGLALRLTDHVRVVRETAQRIVLTRVSLESSGRIMPLLEHLSDRDRAGPTRDRYLRAAVRRNGDAAVWQSLRRSPDRRLRRAAVRHSVDSGLLELDDVVPALQHETDHTVVRLLSGVVIDQGSAATIAAALLTHPVGETRALGLARLDAADTDPATLERLLFDRSVMVRLWARRRWAELGQDAASTYAAVAHGDGPARLRAHAYIGLRETGTRIPREEALALARSGEPALIKVGLSELVDSATPEDVPYLLGVVRAGTNSHARLAAVALLGLRRAWSVDDLHDLASSEDPVLRRRAWVLRRRLGGWNRTIADLEILTDADPALAGHGRNVTAPMYAAATDAERARIAELLARTPLSRARRDELALAAGLPRRPAPSAGSIRPMADDEGRLARAVEGLTPGYFALVMATGIISVGLHLEGFGALSELLLVVCVAAFLVLVVLNVWRFVAFRHAVAEDFMDPRRGFGFFTFVAGTNVLGVRLGLDGAYAATAALLVPAGLAWLALGYVVPWTAVLGRQERPVVASANGTWFIWVVASQSVAIGAATLEPVYGSVRRELAMLAVVSWSVGVFLYAAAGVFVAARLMLYDFGPDDLTPPYWVSMGALAITVLAGARIVEMADAPMVDVTRGLIAGLAVVFWAFASWLIPVLVAAGWWRHVRRKVPLRYDATLWSIIFPLGMYAVAGIYLGRADRLPLVEAIGSAELWVALGAWLAVFAAMTHAVLSPLLRPGRRAAVTPVR